MAKHGQAWPIMSNGKHGQAWVSLVNHEYQYEDEYGQPRAGTSKYEDEYEDKHDNDNEHGEG